VELKTAEANWQIERSRLESQREFALSKQEAVLQEEHRRVRNELQGKLLEAADNIEKLKKMVLNSRDGTQGLFTELKMRIRELESTNMQLQESLRSSQEQALRDHSQDTEALAEMKRKFEALVKRYEQQLKAKSTMEASYMSGLRYNNHYLLVFVEVILLRLYL
jgi:hypothetical protein